MHTTRILDHRDGYIRRRGNYGRESVAVAIGGLRQGIGEDSQLDQHAKSQSRQRVEFELPGFGDACAHAEQQRRFDVRERIVYFRFAVVGNRGAEVKSRNILINNNYY